MAGVKRQLLEQLRRRCGSDTGRYERAERVVSCAEDLLKQEAGADWHVVVPAALLLDLDVETAEDHAAAARRILMSLGLGLEDVECICGVISHHHETGISSPVNSRVLCDAEGLAELDRLHSAFDADDPRSAIGRRFLTEAGKRMAAEKRRAGTLQHEVSGALQSIRSLVQADGGDVELVDVTEDGVARIRLTGACDGCPMSAITVRDGIERHLTRLVPELKGVVALR
jgi:Fe-S cluster biogenesis protein NfuA